MRKIEILQSAIDADLPVILWGAPGTGKTAVVRSIAKSQGRSVVTLIGSQCDPTDIGGLPIPDGKGRVSIAPPAWVDELSASNTTGLAPILFLDEISCAPPSVQAALLRVIHERVAAGVELRCRIVCAANHADTAADGGILGPAVGNRLVHIDWSGPTASEWSSGEVSGWGGVVSPSVSRWAARIGSVLEKHSSLLLCPPKNGDISGAWPSPRSWSASCRLLAGFKTNVNLESVLSCCVGNAAAAEMSVALDAQDLPDPEAILLGKAKLPSRGDQVLAASLSLAAAACENRDDRTDRINRAWDVLGGARPDTIITAARALRSGAPLVVHPVAVALGERLISVGV